MNKEHIFNGTLTSIDCEIQNEMNSASPCSLEQHKERQENLEQLLELRGDMVIKAVKAIHG